MKNNHASDWQPGTLKTPSEYSRRAFYALSRHFPSTFWIPKQNEYYRGVQKVLARCTSSLDLHMLIVPFWYLFRTLLVPKVATPICVASTSVSAISQTPWNTACRSWHDVPVLFQNPAWQAQTDTAVSLWVSRAKYQFRLPVRQKMPFFRAFITLRSQFHLHHRSQRALTEIVSKITPNLSFNDYFWNIGE